MSEMLRFFSKTIIVITVLLLLSLLIGLSPQHSNAMYPAVRDGDLLVSLKIGANYQSGSVCLYKNKKGKLLCGRIVASAGDSVDFNSAGELTVNGLIASEDIFYPSEKSRDNNAPSYPYKVPSDHYFILNDYRSDTNDSRSFGAVAKGQLKGQLLFLFRIRGF